jgi:hypothetical protein
MAARNPWTFSQNLPAELRIARATEYVACYLDRIDQSLESIATSLASGAGNEQMRNQLQTIEQALRDMTQIRAAPPTFDSLGSGPLS